MSRVVALFSGGLDSTTMVWKLMSEGWEIILLSFNTYRRNPREVEAGNRIAEMVAPVAYMVQDLQIVRELFDFPPETKKMMEERLDNPPNILIPYKNIIYYSLAAHIASQMGAEAVAGGHTLEDQTSLPDAGRTYLDSLESVLGSSIAYPRIHIHTPLIGLDKPGIVGLGISLSAPLELTWSCWRSGVIHCGVCEGCTARRKAFEKAGVSDKTKYEAE